MFDTATLLMYTFDTTRKVRESSGPDQLRMARPAFPENLPVPAFVSKLTPEQWAEARQLRVGGATYDAIAKRYGLSRVSVRKHARNNDWPMADAGARSGAAAPAIAAGKGTPVRSAAAAQLRRDFRLRMLRIYTLDLSVMELRMKKRVEAAAEQDADAEFPGSATARSSACNRFLMPSTK